MGYIRFKSMLKVLVFLAVVLPVSSAFAATYYVDPAAANDSGNGSSTSPKKYINSAISLMSSGDTVILRDGVYTGANNTIGDYGSPQQYLPSGSAGNFTTLKAEHVGQAILDGQFTTVPFAQGNGPTYRNYLHVDGIHFKHGSGSVFSIAGNHNWVSNCGFEDGMKYSDNSETPIAYIGGDSTYNLIEDCWVWGKGRYGFYTSDPHSSGSHNNIFRRVVVRLDASPSNWMSAGLRFYSSHDGAMQNCIVIDSLVGSNSGDGGTCAECWSYAQGGGSSDGEWGHIFNSNIALNNPQRPAFTNEAGNSTSPETWTNSVWWDVQYGMLVYSLPSTNTWNISNMLMGGKSTSKVFGDGFYYGGNRSEQINLSNSIIVNSSASSYGQPGISLSRNISNTNVYNDVTTACNSGDGCSNSGQTTNNPFTSVVKYLPRAESGTQGPTIMYQVGGTGTFYGDSGWNSTSTSQLWPYANEAVWAAKMKAYNVNTVSGNRGFAALAGSSSTPLTDYIWGYLGNPKPDIYGGGTTTGDTTAPTVSITAPTTGSSVTGTVSVTASASDNVGVSKVEFYVNGALQATDTATPYIYSWNTSALAAGTYTLVAKAYDAANNVGQSSVNVTVGKDTTAPTASISSPVNGSTVSGMITVNASATDNVGVTKLELYGNGSLLTASNVSPLSYNVYTTTAPNGSYSLVVKAYDAAGNVGQTTSTINISNSTSGGTTGGGTTSGITSIWPATATPGVVDQPDTSAVELGVKFRSDVSGYITGIRFYKASTNTGTHVGNLWSSTGSKLASATFTNETASGWQTVTFASPVAITANTVYVASYHTNVGHYSNDMGYFTGKGADSAPLHALASGVSGSNGVYAYGSTSSFPNSSWNDANYWVDVLMSSSSTSTSTSTGDTTAPTVSLTAPVSGATVSGTVAVAASASDNVGVSKVEFYLNGTLKSTSTAAPYSYNWDTTSVANGSYTLSAKAYDAAGNVGQSSSVTVNVSNATATSVPIAFVQVASKCPSSGSSVSLSYGKTQTAGNMNIVVVGWNDTTSSVQSVKDSLGNVYTLAAGPVSGTGLRQSIYYAKGIAGGSNTVTVTFNQTAKAPDIRIQEYAGVSALDKTSSATGSGSTSNAPSVTTSAAKELLFAANMVATGTAGSGSGFTARTITYPDSDIAEDRIVSSTGTYSASAPLTSSGAWVMQLVTFR